MYNYQPIIQAFFLLFFLRCVTHCLLGDPSLMFRRCVFCRNNKKSGNISFGSESLSLPEMTWIWVRIFLLFPETWAHEALF